MHFLFLFFRFIPKSLLSLLVGIVVRIRFPQPLARWLVAGFIKIFGIDLSDAEKPLEEFATIEDVFVRKLRSGSRSIHEPVCSPADGYLAVSASSNLGLAIQAKGWNYNLIELLFDRDPKRPYDFVPHWYQTIYLAPQNYHRVHSPFRGFVERVRYVPGELWPVNQLFVGIVPNLFIRNERVIFDFRLENGGRAYVVMVGATNVGRIVTPLVPQLVTNSAERQITPTWKTYEFEESKKVDAGDEIGTFMLGSTVIIVYDRLSASDLVLKSCSEPQPIRMGQPLAEKNK